ncbi:MAG TPA: MlaD family protein [Kofleriaceae bacterium]
MEVFLEGIDDQLATRVGLWALGVLVVVIAFFVFVFGRIDWGARTRVHVYFHHVGALHEGAPFVVAGRTVGKVEAIALAPKAAPLGGDDGVAVTVAIDARDAAGLDPAGDIFIASKGTLSDRYLELGPNSDGKIADQLGLHADQPLVGRDPPELDRALQRTWDNLQDFGAFVADIKPELDALTVQVAILRAHFDPTAPSALPNVVDVAPLFVELAGLGESVRTLRETGLGGDAGIAHASEVIARAATVATSARAMLAKLDATAQLLQANLAAIGTRGQGAGAKLDLAIDRIREDIAKLDPLLATIAAIQQSIDRGEGSLMKLANDPEFPEDAKALGKVLKRHPWRVIAHPIR